MDLTSSETDSMSEYLAAVDMGTNSLHMVVARVLEGGGFELVEREKEMVRLGHGSGDMRRLRKKAIDRAIAALDRYRRIAESRGATLRVVATSAVREAENKKVLVGRALDEAGVEVEVISGKEEARLIHLGVLQALPLLDKRHLVIDIGGGSTELIVGQGDDVLFARSLKIGAIRLTAAFFSEDPLDPDMLRQCRRQLRSVLRPLVHEVTPIGFEMAVGSSGSIEAVAAIARVAADGFEPRTLNALVISRGEVTDVVERLSAAPTVARRRRVPGLDPKRADIILGGAVALDEIMRAFDLVDLTVSEYALREGVLLDSVERRRGRSRRHLGDIRRRSVLRLAEACDPDPAHSSQVAFLAIKLFDELRGLHGLGDLEREILEAAALLANVGMFVSHDMHHKHSYYVIRNSEQLLGFNDREIELIAVVARYHRKGDPRPRHPEFAALDASDKERVPILAGILRLAIGLDRSHEGRVFDANAVVDVDGNEVVIEAVPADDTDISLEIFAARERVHLLEATLGTAIEVRAAT